MLDVDKVRGNCVLPIMSSAALHRITTPHKCVIQHSNSSYTHLQTGANLHGPAPTCDIFYNQRRAQGRNVALIVKGENADTHSPIYLV